MHCTLKGVPAYNDGRSEQLVLASFLDLDFLLDRFLQFILAAFDQLMALLMSVHYQNFSGKQRTERTFNASLRENCLSQLWHGYGLTARWMRLCRFRSWFRLKLCGHLSHLNGRSFVGPAPPCIGCGGCPPYICCMLATCPLLKPGRIPDCNGPIIDICPPGLWTLDITGPVIAGSEYDGHGWRW